MTLIQKNIVQIIILVLQQVLKINKVTGSVTKFSEKNKKRTMK